MQPLSLRNLAPLFIFWALAANAVCLAGAGDLDPSFGTGGLVTGDFGSEARAVAIQADGKIVATGRGKLARYNTDGSLDPSFGDAGVASTFFGASSLLAGGVVIQADGKIVIAGGKQLGNSFDFAVARFNTDGSPDTTFGTGGVVTTDFASDVDSASAVAIQADGKIVLAGIVTAIPSGSFGLDFGLVRYNTDGTLDPTFGTGGLVRTDLSPLSRDHANAVAIQADGQIVAAGNANDSGGTDIALVRYNTDGSLDETFGTGGVVSTDDFAPRSAIAHALAIQADGKIVAAGQVDTDFALVRYNTDGSLDTTFGTGGLVTTDFGFGIADRAFAVAIQADGKIVTTGTVFRAGGIADVFALARYNTDGSLDTTFGVAGLVTNDFALDSVLAFDVAIQADGKIVAAGRVFDGTRSFFALARYLGLESPDLLIELLIAQVQGLVPDPLNNGQAKSLLVKLQGAIQKLDAGQNDTAINKLNAFINEVEAFVSAGTLSPLEGDPLISQAQLVLLLL